MVWEVNLHHCLALAKGHVTRTAIPCHTAGGVLPVEALH